MLGVVYRPPSTTVGCFNGVDTIAYKPPLVICGDIYIDLLKDNCPDYVLLVQTYNLMNVITAPMQISDNCSSLIDHMVYGTDMTVSAGVYDITVADHCPSFMFIPQAYLCPSCYNYSK